MQLIIDKVAQVFNAEVIQPGYLLYAKHKTWNHGQAGFVTLVTSTEIQVQYHPSIRNVTNHFRLPAAEVAAGEWEVRWSSDLKQIGEFVKENEDDTGGTDL